MKTREIRWALFAVAALTVPAAMGCEGGDAKDQAGSDKVEAAEIKALAGPIGQISAFLPYIQTRPEPKLYEPQDRPDLDKAATFAGNEIRHAANGARQKADRSKSAAMRALAPAFTALNKACTNAADEKALAGCRAAVEKLNEALKQSGETLAAAGTTEKLPLVGSASVDDEAKASIAEFKKAIGPSELEKKYLAMRLDESAEPQTIIDACDAALEESKSTTLSMEKRDPEMKKVAAHHQVALDAQCIGLKKSGASLSGVEQCKDKPKTDDDCKRICATTKTLLARGVQAAAFAKLPEKHKETCEDKK